MKIKGRPATDAPHRKVSLTLERNVIQHIHEWACELETTLGDALTQVLYAVAIGKIQFEAEEVEAAPLPAEKEAPPPPPLSEEEIAKARQMQLAYAEHLNRTNYTQHENPTRR